MAEHERVAPNAQDAAPISRVAIKPSPLRRLPASLAPAWVARPAPVLTWRVGDLLQLHLHFLDVVADGLRDDGEVLMQGAAMEEDEEDTRGGKEACGVRGWSPEPQKRGSNAGA